MVARNEFRFTGFRGLGDKVCGLWLRDFGKLRAELKVYEI